MRPFISGWFYIPLTKIKDVEVLKRKLTVYSSYFMNMQGSVIQPIQCYDMSNSGYIGVPLRFGIDKWISMYKNRWVDEVDDFSNVGGKLTAIRLPDLNHEKANQDQKIIVPQVIDALKYYRSCMLVAATGFGKTVAALYIAATLGLKTVIIVNKNQLKLQWIKEIELHLGIKESDIGIIQADSCQSDKDICIAMLQTLHPGKYTENISNKFGFAIYDEVHNLGADEFSKALGIFNCRYMLGMTATDERSDGRDKVYKLHFGVGDCKTKSNALPIKVHVLSYIADKENWGVRRQGKLKCISLDSRRNRFIAGLIEGSFKAGRQIVVFSEFKKHLNAIYAICVQKGVDPSKCGHFYLGGEAMQISDTKLSRDAYFEWIKSEAQVIFSTYGMMKEGISIDRLDLGIDATPQVKATQLIGRIRRPHIGKPLPIWYTIRDVMDKKLNEYCDARIIEYINDETVELVRHDL
jgi:superfamily II DNA or RNA helicase